MSINPIIFFLLPNKIRHPQYSEEMGNSENIKPENKGWETRDRSWLGRARGMAQWVKAIATMKWVERTNSCKSFSRLHVLSMAHGFSQSKMIKCNKMKLVRHLGGRSLEGSSFDLFACLSGVETTYQSLVPLAQLCLHLLELGSLSPTLPELLLYWAPGSHVCITAPLVSFLLLW